MNHTLAHRLPFVLRPDARRVLIRPFIPGQEPRAHHPADVPRALKIMSRILALSDEEVEADWRVVMEDFGRRHPDLDDYFLRRFEAVTPWLPTDAVLSGTRRKLIGAYFTHEYSLEAAALFNPSVVACPDQSGLPAGALRFVLSLRAVGEGHISSIGFRCGILGADDSIDIGEPARWVVGAEPQVDPFFESAWFSTKCRELGVDREFVDRVLDQLPAQFNEGQLLEVLKQTRGPSSDPGGLAAREQLLMLAKSNFSVSFQPHSRYSERVIFPVSPSQTNGIEDARFVRFVEDDGRIMYYATYTAYDGRMIFPQFLETPNFLQFHFRTLQGAAVQNKGMALFPRKIGGRYMMLSRQDGENIRLMSSESLYQWDTSEVLARPTQSWEFIQMGNCGSPLETEAGWLVLTHGVGAMRKYCIGAMLLDLDDPSRIIGRFAAPLIRPEPGEREGYVPNVVYSCGSLIHHGRVFLPFATSDWFTSFATVPLEPLLQAMTGTQQTPCPASDS
jgi:predicted GH43/DUF377 family glycosyl hydrolase